MIIFLYCIYQGAPRHKLQGFSGIYQLHPPVSNPRCYRFEVWAFSFTSRRLSRLSCINEYLAIDSGGNVSE